MTLRSRLQRLMKRAQKQQQADAPHLTVFLVGQIDEAHLRLSYDDSYFSQRHFVVEINPPRCRVLDLKSRNGTFVNGERVHVSEIAQGDQITAGHIKFRITVVHPPRPSSRRSTSRSCPRPEIHVYA